MKCSSLLETAEGDGSNLKSSLRACESLHRLGARETTARGHLDHATGAAESVKRVFAFRLFAETIFHDVSNTAIDGNRFFSAQLKILAASDLRAAWFRLPSLWLSSTPKHP
jgi:hypothetical protein